MKKILSESINSTINTVLAVQAVRYVCAGGSAVAVQLLVLYALTEYAEVYYLTSAVGAFLVAVTVSFILQKYWTFGDTAHRGIPRQAAVYLLLHVTNLALNTVLLYSFVTYLQLWYLFSQVIVSAILAVAIFFINKLFIFRT